MPIHYNTFDVIQQDAAAWAATGRGSRPAKGGGELGWYDCGAT